MICKVLLKSSGMAVLLCSVVVAFAAPPKTINYQGYLTGSGGVPITSPAKLMGFALYSTTSGKTPLWNESQDVKVDKGIYSVVFGSVNEITLPFDTQYYLGISVSPDTSEMAPRHTLTSVPYSFRAIVAENISMGCLDGGVLIYKAGKWQCGTIITFPNAAATCIGPDCTISMCTPNRGNCNNLVADGCETDLLTVNNCGSCGNACVPPPGMDRFCSNRQCVYFCSPGLADCDGDSANGCETFIGSNYNCGACGNTCDAAHGSYCYDASEDGSFYSCF